MTPNSNKEKGKLIWPQVVMVIGSLVAAFLIGIYGPGNPTERLAMTTGYALLVLVFLFGMVILVEIIRGNIELDTLLSEDGKASMSRFQLLVFTFVIAMSLFLMVVEQKGTKFPEIPANVLTLLGISASTYAVSKGIQAGSKNGNGAGDADKKE